MVILPVIASVVAALALIIAGSYEIYDGIEGFFSPKVKGHAVAIYLQVTLLTSIVSAIDFFLIATVLLIFGVGLYELFISQIDFLERSQGNVLLVHSLDQLKTKLVKVILMILIVTFFKYAIHFRYKDVLNLLYLAAGTLLLSLSIYFSNKKE